MSARILVGILVALAFSVACNEQHKPYAYLQMIHNESSIANKDVPKLTAEGKIPEPSPVAVASGDPIENKYNSICASCHGTDGKGAGPGAVALNPKPRNFTDVAWQDKTADERITKVIKEGGASVGLSAMMAPWGAVFNDEEIAGLVKKIRAYKGK